MSVITWSENGTALFQYNEYHSIPVIHDASLSFGMSIQMSLVYNVNTDDTRFTQGL